jgi:hypothetical protein
MRHRVLFGAASVAAIIVACSSGGSDPPGGTTSSSGGSSGLTSSSGGSSGASSSGGATSSGGSSSGGAGQNQLAFTAKQEGTAPPNGTKTVVLWSVFATMGDYLYSYGGGQTTGADVYVSLTGAPPADALNRGQLGIGLVATLNDGADLPEGKVVNDWKTLLRAITPMHAVIYRNATEQLTSKGWELTFPQGYACGKCVEADVGFDTFEVVDCAEMRLVPMSPEPSFCNFT